MKTKSRTKRAIAREMQTRLLYSVAGLLLIVLLMYLMETLPLAAY